MDGESTLSTDACRDTVRFTADEKQLAGLVVFRPAGILRCWPLYPVDSGKDTQSAPEVSSAAFGRSEAALQSLARGAVLSGVVLTTR